MSNNADKKEKEKKGPYKHEIQRDKWNKEMKGNQRKENKERKQRQGKARKDTDRWTVKSSRKNQ